MLRCFLALVVLSFIVSSCSIRIGSHKKKKSQAYKSKNDSNSISNILRDGKIVEYKDFKNWENKYLEDLKFDIFLDSSGSQVAILNKQNQKKPHELIKSKKIIFSNPLPSSNIDKDEERLDSLMKKIENLNSREKNNDREVDSIIISFMSDKINETIKSSSAQNENMSEYSSENQGDELSQNFSNKPIKSEKLGENRVIMIKSVDYKDIPNFTKDVSIGDAIFSFAKSCDIFVNRSGAEISTKNLSLGTASDWHEVCKKIKLFKDKRLNQDTALKYFVENFIPIKIYNKSYSSLTDQGTFTGYYELDLEASEKRTNKYKFPIYSIPNECKTKQCATRNDIRKGSISGRGLEMFYAKNPFDIYMLQIQGSGIILLEDGKYARVGFGGTNRRSGTNIFSYMRDKCIPKCKARLNEILDWFEENPERGEEVLAKNDSYIFFRILENNGDGAFGAQGVSLTPSRSIAVDNLYIPYGVPVFVDTNFAIKTPDNSYVKASRLFVAQDTGSAIKGPIRADIFFGHGTKARYLAEKQHFPGSYYMLVPRSIVEQRKIKVL
jgi:membrane-bound lytic murein transglycosylase A